MSDIAIRVENLSKQYQIGEAQGDYVTLRDQLIGTMQGWFRRKTQDEANQNSFWALKDVSFEVSEGDVIGLVGRNGAGKSTLLKLLSRITEPTQGRAAIYGRVASLLEVGTGFHGELSGRENIYLNGSVLGMTRAEIKRKFDEIVAFSGVETFIDTPIKRYSSGMKVRLAFSVAAHLDPEILIIDEVLAVGDLTFQEKCLGKMEEVAHGGRTVLFVSHNMGAVKSLCTKGVWLKDGQLEASGDIGSVVNAYVKSTHNDSSQLLDPSQRRGTGEARITDLKIVDGQGEPSKLFSMGEPLAIEHDIEVYQPMPFIWCLLEVKRLNVDTRVIHMANEDCRLHVKKPELGVHKFRIELPDLRLYPGNYTITMSIWINYTTPVDWLENVMEFSVTQGKLLPINITPNNDAIFFPHAVWEKKS